MKELTFDAAVIGGGAAGMAAAAELRAAGLSCAIVERGNHLGGVLPQCVHSGFGLVEYREELTGPEFAQRLETALAGSGADTFLSSTVLEIEGEGDSKLISCASPIHGMFRIRAKAAVLAMGCRERNRGNIRIPGSRPAGVFTAGLAQRLLNIEGYLPGKEIVIIGSGDIGLIMARRLSWSGCAVKAVVEIQARPSGLPRNVAQCVEDFGIPLYLAHATTRILGTGRVSGVEIAPLLNGGPDTSKTISIPCDTILLSVGLVPENELSREAGVELNPMTGGPWADARLMTNQEGIFACGNVLHVHDLVDYAVEEARRAGKFAAAWARGERHPRGIGIKAGANVRYAAPAMAEPGRENKIYARSLIWADEALLEIKMNGSIVHSKKMRDLRPSEMISLSIDPEKLAAKLGTSTASGPFDNESLIEISLKAGENR
jgi:NADPH-dependent 2,4-dienoyl-CoA reductase/sulfur reductase-like enzyme